MIKAIILDVDGVIVGEKKGYNSPYPAKEVIKRLASIKSKGIAVSLCTAKPHWAISKIITDAGLSNLHITEGGAVIIDLLDNKVLKTYTMETDEVAKVATTYLEAGVYTEVYSLDEYYIQKSQQDEFTQVHNHILQKEPKIVDSLIDQIAQSSVVKVMPIAENEADKARLVQLFKPFEDRLTLSWGVHRVALPRQFGIITAKGISKQQAALEIASYEGVNQEELLGIGDSTSDWQFIEHCGYGATMANGTAELKQLVAAKGSNSFVGGHVDENGVLAVFDYFQL
jgi:hydroxymethylpyrimidine pyrophosphatase-like HAD family hydrolase